MTQVFISYDREDDGNLNSIRTAIQDAGLTPWFDQVLKGGQHFPNEIANAIRRSDIFMVVLSKNSLQSDWVGREVNSAFANNKKIIPLAKGLNLAKIDGPDWAVRLRDNFHAISFRQKISPKLRGEISEALRSLQTTPRNGKIFSFVNFKGGVGKTTLCALTSFFAATEQHQRTLIVDLDPQENLSDLFLASETLDAAQAEARTAISLFEPSRLSRSFSREYDYKLFVPYEYSREDGHKLGATPHHLLPQGQLALLPSDFRMVKFARGTAVEHHLYRRNFDKTIAELRRRFDLIFLDCGPTASLLSNCALGQADLIVAPVQPNTSAARGLTNMARAARNVFDLQIEDKSYCVFNMTTASSFDRGYITDFRQGLVSDDIRFIVDKISPIEIPRVDALSHLNNLLDERRLEAISVATGIRAAYRPLSAFTKELLERIRRVPAHAG